ncbi:MAG TPA: SurA N-terminal domain-containing protein, partial [Acidocella sp.]|nr:SurA N-terminal domain-containing protein [Acidocella sp.]
MKQMSLGPVAVILAGVVCLSAGAVRPAAAQEANIAAVVNGQVITNADVDNRAMLLALSTGMKPTPDVLNRLKPQITQQLIDQTLQMQEISKLKVNVPEADIATAIGR